MDTYTPTHHPMSMNKVEIGGVCWVCVEFLCNINVKLFDGAHATRSRICEGIGMEV